jgi:predicted TPR repeat methyltransferase
MATSADALTLGIQQQQAGNLGQAEALYRQVLDAEPSHPNARFRLAVLCQMQSRLAEAVEHYRHLLQCEPGSVQALNNLGLVLARLGQHAEALACCTEAVRLRPDCAEFVNNLGSVHGALGEREQAGAAYRRALELKPQYPAAWNNLGNLHLTQNRLDEAVRCFQEALALAPTDATLLTNLGSALLQQGKALEAANCYRQALRIRPDHADARRNMARVQETVQQWEETAARAEERLRHSPDDANGYATLGDLYYYALGKHAEAARCYQQVIALCPDNARARFLADVLGGSPQLTRVPADQVGTMYDAYAAGFDQRATQRGDCSPEMLKSALGAPPATPSLDILDLGCGTGLCGVLFRGWARTLAGVDLSANMLTQARQRGIYDELIQADVLGPLQNSPGRFDLIVASDVLLYLGDLGPLFQAVHDALRPGGRFAFTIDSLDGPGDYRVTPWAHFAHSLAYVQNLAARTQMQAATVEKVVFPREGGRDAPGFVVVLSRQ